MHNDGKTSDTASRPVSISVAVPIYNEESVLPELYRRLDRVLSQIEGDHEIILVNDGSSDGSAQILSTLAATDARVKLIQLSRNFGHQAALSAAFDYVTGDVMILMDGDLQDTPEAIPQFVEQYRLGYDVVYAIREKRKESWLLRTAYTSFYWLISKLSDLDLPKSAGDFGLLSKRAVQEIRNCPERHRYLRGLRRWVGYRQIGIRIEREARFAGESKYSWLKLIRLALDGIFSFSVQPLRAATWMGLLTILCSVGFTAYAIFAHLFLNGSPVGFTALITAITFLAGVQLLFLGVLGEYVGRIYEQVKMRPLYVVDQVQSIKIGNVSSQDEFTMDTLDELLETQKLLEFYDHPEGCLNGKIPARFETPVQSKEPADKSSTLESAK